MTTSFAKRRASSSSWNHHFFFFFFVVVVVVVVVDEEEDEDVRDYDRNTKNTTSKKERKSQPFFVCVRTKTQKRLRLCSQLTTTVRTTTKLRQQSVCPMCVF